MEKPEVNKKRPLLNPAEVPSPKGYCQKQVEDGVKAFFQVLGKSSNKSLFQDGEFITLEITCVRIPNTTYTKYYRYVLPHGFLKETSEVLLFVRGSKKYSDEHNVKYYKNLLSEAGITRISEVITVNQLMQEYKSYEMRIRLAQRFDYVLADARVSNKLHGLLGKHFFAYRKMPTPIKLTTKKLKDDFEKTLRKSSWRITGKSRTIMSTVGNTNQTQKQISENIEAIVKEICVNFPGKWGNIRALYIRSPTCPRVPLYFSFADPNPVQVPKVKGRINGPKFIPTENDEISTLPDGYKVLVKPDGEVKVKGKKADGTVGWLTDAEIRKLDLDFDVEDGSENEEEIADERENVSVNGDENNEFTDSDEEEAEVEAAEEAYLKELSMAGSDEKGMKRKMNGVKENISPVKKAKKIVNGKNNSFSAQWNVEELPVVNDIKPSEEDTLKKSSKKSKKSNKTLTSVDENEELISNSEVKVEKQKKLEKKVTKEEIKDILKDKAKLEKVLRKKKKPVSL